MSILKDLISRCGEIDIAESPVFVVTEPRYSLCVMTITDENGKQAVGIGEISRDGKGVYLPATLAYNRARINAYREYLGDIIDDVPEYGTLPENESSEEEEVTTPTEVATPTEEATEMQSEVRETIETAKPETAVSVEPEADEIAKPEEGLPELDKALAEAENGFDPDDVFVDVPRFNQIRVSDLIEADREMVKRMLAKDHVEGRIAVARPKILAYIENHGIVL